MRSKQGWSSGIKFSDLSHAYFSPVFGSLLQEAAIKQVRSIFDFVLIPHSSVLAHLLYPSRHFLISGHAAEAASIHTVSSDPSSPSQGRIITTMLGMFWALARLSGLFGNP